MHQSARTQWRLEVVARPVLETVVRGQLAGRTVSISDVVVRAVAHALREVPELNVRSLHGRLVPHGTVEVHVSESGVTVSEADRKSLFEVAGELRELSAARGGGRLRRFVGRLAAGRGTAPSAVVTSADGGALVAAAVEVRVGDVAPLPRLAEGWSEVVATLPLVLSVEPSLAEGGAFEGFVRALEAYLADPLEFEPFLPGELPAYSEDVNPPAPI